MCWHPFSYPGYSFCYWDAMYHCYDLTSEQHSNCVSEAKKINNLSFRKGLHCTLYEQKRLRALKGHFCDQMKKPNRFLYILSRSHMSSVTAKYSTILFLGVVVVFFIRVFFSPWILRIIVINDKKWKMISFFFSRVLLSLFPKLRTETSPTLDRAFSPAHPSPPQFPFLLAC